MAHYAFIDNNGIVIQVIPGVDETETIEGLEPEAWYGAFTGNACRRTSYNTHGGQHATGGTPYRKNYAGIGFRYDPDRDAFIPPQPFPSWLLNEDTCLWDPPTPYPNDGGDYTWNETDQTWEPADA
jgi:hypothetical protein